MRFFLALASLLHLTLSSPYNKPDLYDGADGIQLSEDITLDSGVGPYSDNGRAEMMDDVIPWKVCPPHYLNCRQCPRDMRCKKFPGPRPSSSLSVKPQPFRPWPTVDPQEPQAIAGEQIPYPQAENVGDDDGKKCPLQECSKRESENTQCGQDAQCIGSYCVCTMGLKPVDGTMARGWRYPAALRVHVDPGIICNHTCTQVFCSEVPRARECFKQDGDGEENVDVEGQQDQAKKKEIIEEVETDIANQIGYHGGHGVVQRPGAE